MTMKLLSTTLAMSIVLASATAFADEPIKLRLKVEPVTNQAELQQLMRQNTVRVALQRYRLWQQTAASEQARAEDQEHDGEAAKARDRARERTQDRLEGSDRDEAKKTTLRKRKRTKSHTAEQRTDGAHSAEETQAARADGEPAKEQSATQTQKRKQERQHNGAHAADNAARQSTASQQREELRNILRKQRLGGESLDGKLRERTRTEERTRRQEQERRDDKQKQRKGKGGSGSGSRGGDR
jgi:hypothetical protein